MVRSVLPSLVLVACVEGEGTPVGVTLDDGQVLVGDVTTGVLALEGAFGAVEIPLDDVGMVIPVEGRTVGESHGQVTVWLRNGSELRGQWTEPELAMGIEVGGDAVPIEVPAHRMQALQLRGGEEWPEGGLYRVRTTWGDDFLVDPEETRIPLVNDLGEFSPFLSELRAVGPVGDPTGDWRIELETGTVLIGQVQQDELAFALPMGPDEIVVPLDALVRLERGAWSQQGLANPSPPAEPARMLDTFNSVPSAALQAPQARPGLTESAGWFDNRRLEDAKH